LTFVITQNCCADASCVAVCPVDCIRPVPSVDGSPPQSLYIDPQTCVDCGVCMEVCPVDAIYYEDDLPTSQAPFLDINARYFAEHPLKIRAAPPKPAPVDVSAASLRVAIVGAGPSACYAATELARAHGVEVSIFDRLPTPFGLVRAGVAPDHQRTKNIVAAFEPALRAANASCYFNVEVGRDLTHAELLEHHHAVIYAVGASRSSDLGIPGEHLPGHHAAAELVAWYNGHPDHAEDDIDLSGTRAVVIGNGNVALDVARVLVMNRDELAATDIAEHALRAISASSIDEVVVLGRRGVADAAFSVGEFLALGRLSGVDVVIAGDLGVRPEGGDGALKYDLAVEFDSRPVTPGHRRVVLHFSTTPTALVGETHVEGVEVGDGPAGEVIETSLVLRSVGYRGTPIDGLPFDPDRCIVPNDGGRVTESGTAMPGVYVTGWIKRGPRGVIGTNRTCAAETVSALLRDYADGRVGGTESAITDLDALLASRDVTVVDWAGWQAIDADERKRGSEAARPRVKIVDRAELLTAAAP
jgi:ferredoxin--NADP+ reductase